MTFPSPAAQPLSAARSVPSERAAIFLAYRDEGHFWVVGLCELLRASASPHAAFANRNTMTHMGYPTHHLIKRNRTALPNAVCNLL